MPNHEDTLQDQFANLLAIFKTNFSHIDPPAPTWWLLWMEKYDFADIPTAIEQLGRHSLKARFTTESTGKALSVLLRDKALRHALTSGTKAVSR